MDVYAPVDAKDRHLSCLRSLTLEVSIVRQQVFRNKLRRSSLCQKSEAFQYIIGFGFELRDQNA